MFAGGAVLLVAWTLALGLLAGSGRQRPTRVAPARVPPEIVLPAIRRARPGQSAAPGAAGSRPAPVAGPAANDARDPGAAGPRPTDDSAARALVVRFLAAYGRWEVQRTTVRARDVLRATAAPDVYRALVENPPRRPRDGFPPPARIGAIATFVDGAGSEAIAELRQRGGATVTLDLLLARRHGALRIAGFAP
jgi:hypothetical protein